MSKLGGVFVAEDGH